MKQFAIPMLGLTPHGGNRILVEIANNLVSRGYSVTIITPNRASRMPYVLDERVLVKKIGPSINSKILLFIIYLFVSPLYLKNKTILANQFLTVLPSWVASHIFHSKYVYFVQGIEYRVYKGKLFGVLKAVCEWTYRKGQIVAANSYLASELENYNKVLLTLKLGVSSKFFSTPKILDSKEFDVIYFLRREKYKRIDRFNALLPFFIKNDVRVLCVSQDSDLLDSYSNRAATLCPKNDEELINALDKSRVLLLTSDHEGFSLPPLEAMARGLPSVMYECGGPKVYAVHEKNCLIVTDSQESSAVKYIEKLLTDKVFYSELSKAGFDTASRFKLDGAINVFVEYLISN